MKQGKWTTDNGLIGNFSLPLGDKVAIVDDTVLANQSPFRFASSSLGKIGSRIRHSKPYQSTY